jgi:uncharacterized protein (TIGR02444 family)
VDGLLNWSLRAYAAPGVADLCLQLQDDHGQSVCLLLWAGWLGAKAARPAPGALADAVGIARAWEDDVVGPLRTARRGLTAAPGVPDAARQSLRTQAHQIELAAESALLNALGALPIEPVPPRADPTSGFLAICAAWRTPAPRERLTALADAFPPV